MFPNALHGASIGLDVSAGHAQLAATFPHVATAETLCLPAHPDATLEHVLVSKMAPSVQAEARPMRYQRSDVRIVLGRDIAKRLACHDVERCLTPAGSVAAISIDAESPRK